MIKTRTVLIVDDDGFQREFLRIPLEEAGFDVHEASSGHEACSMITHDTAAVLLDLQMPGMDGLTTLTELRRMAPEVSVVMVSGQGEIKDAVSAMQHGAMDFLVKPVEPYQLIERVKQAVIRFELSIENQRLRDIVSASGQKVAFVAESKVMRDVLAQARRAAETDATILITGPSGTGKTLLARYIHQMSIREDCPFVTVSCGALPRELIESELFGHEKGAFTGADRSRPGRIETANTGTLFLDEIGELPLDVQPKLLNVLQDRRMTRVGSNKEQSVDIRLIAATNRNLEQAVAERTFREDLFFRINVLRLEMPPLADRQADIPVLAEHVLQQLAERRNEKPVRLTPQAMQRLCAYNWPGNIRELENVLERATVYYHQQAELDADCFAHLRPQDVPGSFDTPTSSIEPLTLAQIEKRAIENALSRHNGNQAAVARELGVSEKTIYNRLRQYREHQRM